MCVFHSDNLLTNVKTLVEDTKLLVNDAAASQEKLASSVDQILTTARNLASTAKQGAASLGSDDKEAQVMGWCTWKSERKTEIAMCFGVDLGEMYLPNGNLTFFICCEAFLHTSDSQDYSILMEVVCLEANINSLFFAVFARCLGLVAQCCQRCGHRPRRTTWSDKERLWEGS